VDYYTPRQVFGCHQNCSSSQVGGVAWSVAAGPGRLRRVRRASPGSVARNPICGRGRR
jgi:hypothetical protein